MSERGEKRTLHHPETLDPVESILVITWSLNNTSYTRCCPEKSLNSDGTTFLELLKKRKKRKTVHTHIPYKIPYSIQEDSIFYARCDVLILTVYKGKIIKTRVLFSKRTQTQIHQKLFL